VRHESLCHQIGQRRMHKLEQLNLAFLVELELTQHQIGQRRIHTVSGRKSRTGSEDLAAATVERTCVSSIVITTEPFAKRAILPVSKAIMRPPISNSSRKLSSTFRPGCGGASAAACGAASSAAPERNAARLPGTASGTGRRNGWRRRAR
jgi:hypothetical protein